MPGGKPDPAKRANVRRLLLTQSGQEMSDSEAARQCGVSKILVGTVRREMIAAGLHPAGPRHVAHGGPGGMTQYIPGAKVRGGYVFDEKGQIVTELEWLQRLDAEPKLRALVRRALKEQEDARKAAKEEA